MQKQDLSTYEASDIENGEKGLGVVGHVIVAEKEGQVRISLRKGGQEDKKKDVPMKGISNISGDFLQDSLLEDKVLEKDNVINIVEVHKDGVFYESVLLQANIQEHIRRTYNDVKEDSHGLDKSYGFLNVPSICLDTVHVQGSREKNVLDRIKTSVGVLTEEVDKEVVKSKEEDVLQNNLDGKNIEEDNVENKETFEENGYKEANKEIEKGFKGVETCLLNEKGDDGTKR